jgi:hypothetical protein
MMTKIARLMPLALPVYFGVRYWRRLKTSRIDRRSEQPG